MTELIKDQGVHTISKGKQIYSRPVLIRYGSIPQLTQGSGSAGNDNKGFDKGQGNNLMEFFDGESE